MDTLKMLKDGCAVRNITELAETISAGALRLPNDNIQTIQFVFWLVYMAESDLNDIIEESWSQNVLNNNIESDVLIGIRKTLSDAIGKETTEIKDGKEIRKRGEVDPAALVSFSDKIKVYEFLIGRDERTKLLRKLNDIRNDLAHTRIHGLSYEGSPLTDTNVCRKLLCDYFETSFIPKDWTKSRFYKSLSNEEIKIVESGFTVIPKTIND